MGFLPHMFDKGCENLGNSAAHEKSNSASVLCNTHHVLINTTMSKNIKPPVRITLKPPARRYFFLRLKRNTILLCSRKRVRESGSDRGAKQRKRKSGQIQRGCKNRPRRCCTIFTFRYTCITTRKRQRRKIWITAFLI